MKTELRECPFCAGTDLLATDSFQSNPMQYHVYCKSCGTNWVCINNHWNTRPIEDGLRAEIDRLNTALDDTTFMFLERHEAIDELVAIGYQFVRAIKDIDRNEAFVKALNEWNKAVKRIRKEREK